MCADERALALSVCCQRASGLRQRSLRLDALALAVGLATRFARKFAVTLYLLGFYFRGRFDRKACFQYIYYYLTSAVLVPHRMLESRCLRRD